MPDVTEVLKSALSLNADDRAAVAERLLASLDDLDADEVARLWTAEASRRREDYLAGRAASVESSEVQKKAERLFR